MHEQYFTSFSLGLYKFTVVRANCSLTGRLTPHFHGDLSNKLHTTGTSTLLAVVGSFVQFVL